VTGTPDQHPSTDPAEVVATPAVDPFAALLGGGGGDDADGGFDLSGLLAQAQAMQEGLVAAQAEASSREVEGQAGGGVVRITATAGLEPIAVHISPDAVDLDDITMLEDLVLAALRDLVVRANEVQAEALGGLGGLLGGG